VWYTTSTPITGASKRLSSTSLATTYSGAEVTGSRTLYYPYGEQRWSASGGTLPTDFTYAGQRADSFGLMDYRARFYDPVVGRFTSADTIVPSPGDPQSLNRYSYVLNSPLNYQDPSGHAADPGGGAGLTVEDLYEIYNRLADETDPAAWYGHQQIYYATKAVLYELLSEGVSPESQLVKDHAAIVESKYIALANNGFYGVGPALRSAYISAGGESAVAIPLMTGFMALGAGGDAVQGTGGDVQPYEVGRVDDLRNRSRPRDKLQIHHVPQQHPAGQVFPGYDPNTAPGIVLPKSEHRLIQNLRGSYTGTARDLMARDLWNLRSYTGAPNSALQELLKLTRQTYPGALDK
jgi:RHS repeat-associated protein